MPSPRWNKILRDAWLHKPRTSLVVLAIAIGIIGAGSVLNTWSLIQRVTREAYRASNPASATLRSDSIDGAALAAVRAVPGVAEAEARRTVIGSVQVDGSWRTAMLFAADDFTRIRIGVVRTENGLWPPATGTVVLESSSVDFVQAAIGDTLAIRAGDGDARLLPVPGIARDVGLAPGWMEHVVYGFVTPATLAQLGAPSSFNELRIVAADATLDREAVRSLAYRVKAVLERLGRPVSDVDVPVPGRHIHAAQIDSLLYTQGAFGVLALLLSGLLVVNLMAAMLAGQTREIGVMKALGARGGQLAAMYLTLAFILGLVASVVALPVAAVLGRAYATFTAELLNFSTEGVPIPLRIVALQLAVGTLVPVVAAAFPVLRGCRISAGEALRDLGIAARSGAARTPLFRRAGNLPRPLLLSLRNAFRKRQRLALTLLTLATGGAVYLGARNLRSSVVRSVDLLFAPQRFDVMMRFTEPQSPDNLERAVARVAGVARAEAWGGLRAAVARQDGSMGNTFPVVAPPAASRLFAPVAEVGRWFRDGANELVVNSRLLADEPALAVGARVTLVVDGRPVAWSVVGVVETGPSPSAYAAREVVVAIAGDGRVSSVVVAATVRDAPALLDLVQRMRPELSREGYEVRSTQLMLQARKVVEDHLLMVAGFLGVMSQIMIVVGGLGLAASMSLAVLERTREIGVLRAIGARRRSILAMLHVEGLVIASVSWAMAIPLSVPMSVLLARAFSRIMLPVPIIYVPESSGVLRWLLLVLAVSLAACAVPAWHALRITTASALTYE